jgi:hypothetical protein
MLTAVARLAGVYADLCSTGCLLFKEWKSMFFCDDKSAQKVHIAFGSGSAPLKSSEGTALDYVLFICKFMEKCLEEWKEYISTCREKHYSLNFFTTEQLVLLCKELSSVETEPLKPIVFPLLQRVLPNCTQDAVLTAFKEAFTRVAAADEIPDDLPPLEGKEDMEEDPEKLFWSTLLQAGYNRASISAAWKEVGPNADEGNWIIFYQLFY